MVYDFRTEDIVDGLNSGLFKWLAGGIGVATKERAGTTLE
jgi:hypothetical protein